MHDSSSGSSNKQQQQPTKRPGARRLKSATKQRRGNQCLRFANKHTYQRAFMYRTSD